MRSVRIPAIALVLLGAIALGSGVMCGGDGGGTTTPDAGLDCNDHAHVSCDGDAEPVDSGLVDSDATCVMPPANADGTYSDWPGWRRLTELDPCCRIDVARNPGTDVAPLRWVSCFDAMSCQMLDLPPRPGLIPQGIGGAVKTDATGAPSQIAIGRPLDNEGTLIELSVFDLGSSSAIAAWRQVIAPSAAGTTKCGMQFGLSLTAPMLLMEVRHGLGAVSGLVARAPLAQLAAQPVFRPFTIPGFQGNQEFSSSDQIFSFDDTFAGGVFRCALDSLSCVSRKGGPAVALLLDFVSGTDVFAHSEHGDGGWAQEYGMAADGTISLFRGNASAHIGSVATDGTTLAWTETSGNTDVSKPQTKTDVWSAPYTSNAATLSGTAHKVVTLPQATITGGPILVNGYYALYVRGEIDVVRLADGATQRLTAPSGYVYGNPIYVSATEVWAPLGPLGIALLRLPLGAWPDL